jgi:aminoglycoside phosphotransferase (APT) family kinase protein
MSLYLDQAAPVRAGEELPLERLEAYLREHLSLPADPLVVEQFSLGYSNLTYLLRAGSAEMVLRRPPPGNQVKSAHDMGREFRVLTGLGKNYSAVPKPILYCQDENILGAPFYVMARKHGVILRKTLPPGLIIDAQTWRRLGLALVDHLGQLHCLDYNAAGLADLGRPKGYAARQVGGWIKRFHDAQTGDVPGLDRVGRWLGENVPAESAAALIHNDFKFDNLLLDPDDLTKVVAVFDWEMATIGDPLMDLGTTLGYWVESTDSEGLQQVATGPTYLPGNLTRQELVGRYEDKTGRRLCNALFYYCYGLFKIAGIVQQIYARFVRGHTRDPRFARLDAHVAVLIRQAEKSLETGKI